MPDSQKGQALVVVVLCIGLVLAGAMGLALDVAQLYGHTQMAQAAADAAAMAGMMSIYDGTNTGTNAFGTAEYTCTTTDTITPCKFAASNGFGSTSSDTVVLDFPGTGPAAPVGVALSSDAVNWTKVTITRRVKSSFIRMLGGATTTTIKATATAAIVALQGSVPMLILDPSDTNTLTTNGTTAIRICGGPNQSVQVNSAASSAYSVSSVDLSKAGTADDGTCTKGTGASFGVTGAPTTASGISFGSTGQYLQPHSPIQDPLASVCPITAGTPSSGCSASGGPAIPAAAPAKTVISKTSVVAACGNTNCGCIQTSCDLFAPGLYVGGWQDKNQNPVIFEPGLYYMQGGGFSFDHNNGGGSTIAGEPSAMCTGCTADANTGSGMVVYDTGPAGSKVGSNPTGGFTVAQATVFLQGSTKTTTDNQGNTVPGPPYYGILLWEDRTANAQTHNLGQSATAQFSFSGTIYITNTLALMNAGTEQSVIYNGGPNGTTIVQGNIVVGKLSMVGNSTFSMFLNPYSVINVRQVSLVQ